MSPLRSYLLWLLPPAHERTRPILHYVVEATQQRAAEVSARSYVGAEVTAPHSQPWGATRRLRSTGCIRYVPKLLWAMSGPSALIGLT